MQNLTQKIAHTLKNLRKEKGWSLDKTSSQTGVSKAMLGQIERMESSPTIATLWKIASGFDVSFSSFIDKTSSEDTQMVHHEKDLKQIHPKDDKIRVNPIFPYDEALKFETFVIELLPGCEHMAPPHQKGVVEHIVVSSGEIDIYLEDTWHTVKQNQGLRFNADRPHGYRNKNAKPAVFNNIIHYTMAKTKP